MTGVGLSIPADLSFEGWERAGRQLSGIVDSSSWWLGDWLVYGKKHYTDRYRRAIRAAGLQYQTLRNYAWVARRFDLGRRRARLSFQHHAEVASLPAEEQDFWLDRAEQAMWTTKQLRGQVREERVEGDGDRKQATSAVRRIEVPDNRFVWWRRAADHSGVDFDNWVTAMLDRAAEQALSDETGVEPWRLPAVAERLA
ncbi:hypothetical protein GCM10023192_63850 [Amycolatopsis samaneae]